MTGTLFFYEKNTTSSIKWFSCFVFLLSPNHQTGLGNKTSLSSSVTIYLVALLFLWWLMLLMNYTNNPLLLLSISISPSKQLEEEEYYCSDCCCGSECVSECVLKIKTSLPFHMSPNVYKSTYTFETRNCKKSYKQLTVVKKISPISRFEPVVSLFRMMIKINYLLKVV